MLLLLWFLPPLGIPGIALAYHKLEILKRRPEQMFPALRFFTQMLVTELESLTNAYIYCYKVQLI